LPASIQLAGSKNSDRLLLDLAAALGRTLTEKSAAQSILTTKGNKK
jgi:Asp-tRNA(Asn)/Glu-tRNA(Gln) amidotransferase A subunit family amidase